MSRKRRQHRRPRSGGSGRYIPKAAHQEIIFEIDADDVEIDAETMGWAASSFLASRVGVLPIPDLEDRLDGSSVDVPGVGTVRLVDDRHLTPPSGMPHGLAELLADGRDIYLLGAWGEDDADDDELYQLLRAEEAQWLESRIGRDGMIDLCVAWVRDGPMAFGDLPGGRRPRAVRGAFTRWRDTYFGPGWSLAFNH